MIFDLCIEHKDAVSYKWHAGVMQPLLYSAMIALLFCKMAMKSRPILHQQN